MKSSNCVDSLSIDPGNRLALVTSWYHAIAISHTYPADSDVCQCLLGLVDQMILLLGAESLTLDQAEAPGIALVGMGYTQPEVLQQTLLILDQHLRPLCRTGAVSQYEQRLSMLLAGIATGFTRELRRVVVQEQAEMQQAILTAYRQSAKDLRFREEQLRLVITNAPLILVQLDREGTFTFAAGQGLTAIGWQPEQLVGHSIFTRLADSAENFDYYQRGLKGEAVTWTSIYAGRCYEARLVPLYDAQGMPDGAIGLGVDVTERVEAHAALASERESLAQRVAERTAELSQANAELRRSNQMKDDFLATMSHELRTPLHAMLMIVEALQEGIYDPVTPKQAAKLKQIEESGYHLLDLINDTLDLAKIGAGKMELELEAADVKAICQNSLQLTEQAAQVKGLRIVTSFDSQVTVIRCDVRRLIQILVNLLDNAIKFTPAHGTIGLAVEGDLYQQAVRFTVWDTGIGIAETDLSRLFKPFVQLDSSLSRLYQGTGLGLALVYHLTELHGGGVSVTSMPGKGSRFTITLPWHAASLSLADPDPDLVQQQEIPRMFTNQPVIVLAEDHVITRTLLVDYLERKGCQIVLARNGLEAIEQIRATQPDVVIMDIQMPEMNGLEAIKHIRADEACQQLPIIAVTALVMPGDHERCLAAGANAYVSKPISLQHLVAIIEDLVQHDSE